MESNSHVAYEGGDYVWQAALERNQSKKRAQQEEKITHPQWKKKMAHQKRAHPRKLEHLISVLHDCCRTVSLEVSPCSPKPQEETQRKTQRTIKLSEEYTEKQEEHQRKVGKTKGQPKM
jgi:hypothetical protein